MSRPHCQASLLVILLLVPAAAQAAPDYDATFAAADALEQARDFKAAASTLEGLAPDFPLDYRLHLQLGWLHFEAGHYEVAELWYGKALTLSGGATTPLLGLAWSALRRRHREVALAGFAAVLDADPASLSANEGLRLARAMKNLRFDPSGALTLHTHSNRPESPWELGLSLSAPLVIRDRWLLRVGYRHISSATTTTGGTTGGFGRGSSTFLSPPGQDEIHGSVGLRWPRFEAAVHVGYVSSVSDNLNRVTLGGFTLRASPWGDLLAEGSASAYSDGNFYRIGLRWRSPPMGRFRLQPGVAYQRTPTEHLGLGSLALIYQGEGVLGWLGAKAGAEERPTYLSQPAVFNLEGRIDLGLWAGIETVLGEGWRLGFEVEVHHLKASVSGEAEDLLSLFTLVLARTL